MRRAAVLLAAALLSACAGGAAFDERISPGDFFPAYFPAQFSAFAAAGPVVEIRGARPGGASDAEIAAALRLPGWYPQTPFAAVPPGGETARRARIVLNFGATGGVDAIAVCAGRVPEGAVVDRLAVGAAFCQGSAPGSSARLDHARPLAPGDPAFALAMTRLFAELAPPFDPLDRNRRARGRLLWPDD